MTINDLTLDTTQSIDIQADIGDVFRSVLHRLGEGFTKPPQGESMQMTLEQWPGGRWFRDRGNGMGLRHRSIGFIDPAHRQGVTSGWKHILDSVAQDCSARAVGQRS